MRNIFKGLLLSLLFLSPAAATPRTPTVTLHCARKDLGEVLRKISASLGRNLYIGPGVTGTVTADFDKVPAERALGLVLRMQPTEYRYKILHNTVVVATPEKLGQIPDDLFDKK